MSPKIPDAVANFARYYWTYKSAVADVAVSWVGQNMNWIPFDANTTVQSTLYGPLSGRGGGYNPTAGSTMCCWEMPLMAARNHNAISVAKALRVYTNSDYYISAGYVKAYPASRPQKGDLVTWVNAAADDSILGRAFRNFGGGGNVAPAKLGLAHVTLATGGNAGDGSPEVISFWGSSSSTKRAAGLHRKNLHCRFERFGPAHRMQRCIWPSGLVGRPLPSRAAKAFLRPARIRQIGDDRNPPRQYRHWNHLRDLVPGIEPDRLIGQVGQQNLNFSAIAGVDHSASDSHAPRRHRGPVAHQQPQA